MTAANTRPAPVEERRFLRDFAREVSAREKIPLDHLRNLLGAQKYIDIADHAARYVPAGSTILDWGCGFGQTTYVLSNRALDVTPFDLVKRAPEKWQSLFRHMGRQAIYTNDAVRLPFDNERFDAVISCGVLEHVSDEAASLAEIRRVLKPRGLFLIYMLPNKYSYTEAIATLRGVSDHPVKYTRRSLRGKLDAAGFDMLAHSRANMLPKNLTRLPGVLHKLYDALFAPLHACDRLLCALPPVNLVSGVHQAVAQKR